MVDMPKILSVFECHGVDFLGESGEEWYGSCPFCLNDKHLYVNGKTGQYSCKRCGESGNARSFLKSYHEHCLTETTTLNYKQLSRQRDIPVTALRRWKLAYTGSGWVLPCYTLRGTVSDLRRWKAGQKGTMCTKGCQTQMFGLQWLDRKAKGSKARTWLCEGEWDAIAISQMLIDAGSNQDLVLAVPGAPIFKKDWIQHFNDRRVLICYDNDGAGDMGSEKSGRILDGTAKVVHYLCWPDSRPKGWDLKDYCSEARKESRGPLATLHKLLRLVREHHRRETPEQKQQKARKVGRNGMPDRPVFEYLGKKSRPNFEELSERFSKWLYMDRDMVEALKVALACTLSEEFDGPPLWLRLVGPPGSGKTAIVTTLQKSDRVIFRSNITPNSLISGWQGAGEDPSLLGKLNGLTLVCKDWTEVLASPVHIRAQTDSILRGAYDGHVLRNWGNNLTREYFLHFSLIICVTSAFEGFTDTSLGERFVNFKLRSTPEVVEEKMMSAILSTSKEAELERDLQDWVKRFLSQGPVSSIIIQPWFAAKLIPLCQLVALLRANVEWTIGHDRELKFKPEAEYGTRLSKQLTKLAMGLCIVDGKKEPDEDVYKLVERVALDTTRSLHLDVLVWMYKLGGQRLLRKSIEEVADVPSSTLFRRMEDLQLLGVIRKEQISKEEGRELRSSRGGPSPSHVWSLTKRVESLLSRSNLTPGRPRGKARRARTRRRAQ